MQVNYSVIHTDALVIGTGLSGLLAARTLTKKLPTAEILMIGNGLGASPYVHGFNMVLHEEDSMDSFKEDTVVGGRNQSKDELVNALCDGSRKLLPVLEELGIEFNRKNGEYSLLRPLGASHPRVASVGNHTGVAIMNAVRREFETNEKVSALEDTRALRLLRMDGRVCGALTYQIKEKKFTVVVANAVVMACGGFCNIYPFSTNMSDIGGDGIAMAFGAGADLCDLEFVQFEPSAAVAPKAIRGKSVITTMYYEGAVLRNTLGERFMLQYGKDAECVNKDVQAKYIFKEIKEGRGTENGGVYFDATGVGRDRLNEQYDSYVKRYSDVGIDIATTPFEIAPAPHTSLGGIAVDEDCFSGIEGLYACGEIIGGLHGANRLGGNAGLETMVFGRIAGDSVADYLADAAACEVTVDDIEDFVCDTLSLSGETPVTAELLDSLRGQMQNVLGDKLNVLRCGTELEEAVNEIGGMLETLDNSSLEGVSDELKFATLRLVNDLQTAYLLAISAYTRTESCGCHVRTDCDEETEDKYRVVIRNAPEGALVLKESI